MRKTQLKNVKKGDYVKKNENSKTVLIKGDYDRSNKEFSMIYFDDINREIFLKGSTEVFVDFTF